MAPLATPLPGPVAATGLPIVTALATVFAAATLGVPVIVGDPEGPVPTLGSLPADAFLVAVTSGTSGRARPVLRTASSWTESFAPLAELTGIGRDDRVLLTGPLHATMHLFAAVHTLAMGAELTDRPEHATAVHAVPAVFADLLNALPRTAPLRTAVVAGTALSAEIAERAEQRGITVTEYYGAAELSFVAARRFPAPLRPFPKAQVQLRDGVALGLLPVPRAGLPRRDDRTVSPRGRRLRHRRGSRGFDGRRRLADPRTGRRGHHDRWRHRSRRGRGGRNRGTPGRCCRRGCRRTTQQAGTGRHGGCRAGAGCRPEHAQVTCSTSAPGTVAAQTMVRSPTAYPGHRAGRSPGTTWPGPPLRQRSASRQRSSSARRAQATRRRTVQTGHPPSSTADRCGYGRYRRFP